MDSNGGNVIMKKFVSKLRTWCGIMDETPHSVIEDNKGEMQFWISGGTLITIAIIAIVFLQGCASCLCDSCLCGLCN